MAYAGLVTVLLWESRFATEATFHLTRIHASSAHALRLVRDHSRRAFETLIECCATPADRSAAEATRTTHSPLRCSFPSTGTAIKHTAASTAAHTITQTALLPQPCSFSRRKQQTQQQRTSQHKNQE